MDVISLYFIASYYYSCRRATPSANPSPTNTIATTTNGPVARPSRSVLLSRASLSGAGGIHSRNSLLRSLFCCNHCYPRTLLVSSRQLASPLSPPLPSTKNLENTLNFLSFLFPLFLLLRFEDLRSFDDSFFLSVGIENENGNVIIFFLVFASTCYYILYLYLCSKNARICCLDLSINIYSEANENNSPPPPHPPSPFSQNEEKTNYYFHFHLTTNSPSPVFFSHPVDRPANKISRAGSRDISCSDMEFEKSNVAVTEVTRAPLSTVSTTLQIS